MLGSWRMALKLTPTACPSRKRGVAEAGVAEVDAGPVGLLADGVSAEAGGGVGAADEEEEVGGASDLGGLEEAGRGGVDGGELVDGWAVSFEEAVGDVLVVLSGIAVVLIGEGLAAGGCVAGGLGGGAEEVLEEVVGVALFPVDVAPGAPGLPAVAEEVVVVVVDVEAEHQAELFLVV